MRVVAVAKVPLRVVHVAGNEKSDRHRGAKERRQYEKIKAINNSLQPQHNRKNEEE